MHIVLGWSMIDATWKGVVSANFMERVSITQTLSMMADRETIM